jgi:hypothetical protein
MRRLWRRRQCHLASGSGCTNTTRRIGLKCNVNSKSLSQSKDIHYLGFGLSESELTLKVRYTVFKLADALSSFSGGLDLCKYVQVMGENNMGELTLASSRAALRSSRIADSSVCKPATVESAVRARLALSDIRDCRATRLP